MKPFHPIALGLAALLLLIAPRTPAQDSADPHAAPIYSGNGNVQPPKLVHRVDPEYTDEAQRHHVEGRVVIQVTIEKDASLHDPTVVEKLGSGLDEQALKALKLWRFEPATIDGKPVAVRVTIEVKFVLVPPTR